MFDIGWSELLIIGVLALIVVGPKDMPALLRTIGKYLGIIRKQASEFRAQFDEALKETEFDQIRQDMAGLKQDISSTVHQASKQIEKDLDAGPMDGSATSAKNGSDAKAKEGAGVSEAASNETATVSADKDDVSDWASAEELRAESEHGEAAGSRKTATAEASANAKSGVQ
ncbi:MAG: Sec-independent protein translocase protein TatB [Filomicrobium sp.]